MEGYSGTREGGSGPTRRHSNTMTGRLQPHWPHPGGPDHNAVESSGRSYFKTFRRPGPRVRNLRYSWKASRVGHLARFQLRRGTLDPARSWSHLFGFVSSRIFQPLAMLPCLRPSPTQVCKVTLSPLFGFLWTVLCPSHLPCSARPGTGRARPRTLGPGPGPGGDAGPGPRHTALWSLTRTGPPEPSALWSLTRTGPRGPSVRPLGHDLRRAVRRGPLSCPALLGASGCALLPLPTHPRSGWPPPSPHRAGRPS